MSRLLAFCACALAGAVLTVSDTVKAAAPAPVLGVLGNADRFDSVTGQRTQVRHLIVGWGQVVVPSSEMPMIGLNTATGWPNQREAITPRGIAMGHGDEFLFALNAAVAKRGGRAYVRPFGEMNGHWNFYCAFTKSGRPKGPSHSTAIFRKAFARVYLIVHGGPAATINAKLRRLKLPPVPRDLPANPLPDTRVVWNPQGYGSPNLPGNSAQAYYPGDAYVDVVGNDLYNIRGKAEWAAAERLYKAHPTKPYSFPEWGNWGIDDPGFIRRMAQFVKTHRRVEMLAYYNGSAGSVFDLATKPRSLKAYRETIVPLQGLAASGR